jgi:hypothetical protein
MMLFKISRRRIVNSVVYNIVIPIEIFVDIEDTMTHMIIYQMDKKLFDFKKASLYNNIS